MQGILILTSLAIFIGISVNVNRKIKRNETADLFWQGCGMGIFGGLIIAVIVSNEFKIKIEDKQDRKTFKQGVWGGIAISFTMAIGSFMIISSST